MELSVKVKTHDKFANICHPDCPFLVEEMVAGTCLLFSCKLGASKVNHAMYGYLCKRDIRCIKGTR